MFQYRKSGSWVIEDIHNQNIVSVLHRAGCLVYLRSRPQKSSYQTTNPKEYMPVLDQRDKRQTQFFSIKVLRLRKSLQ
jgi:hypothetical protein